jgi:hypothetical protein
MIVRYIGWSADGVTIAATGQHVDHGDVVEVWDLLGESLCERPQSWERVEEKPSKKAAAPAADKEQQS